MVVRRRGPKCGICCAPPKCSLSGTTFFDPIDNRYKWKLYVYYANVASATLTSYDGSAFTYPAFNGTVIVDEDKCGVHRFALTVTSPSGETKTCYFVNGNCCCVSAPRPNCDEYRVPMSRGANATQKGMTVTIAGVAPYTWGTCGPIWSGCDWPSFFNGTYYLPINTLFSKSDYKHCNNCGSSPGSFQTAGGLSIYWGFTSGCPAMTVKDCPGGNPACTGFSDSPGPGHCAEFSVTIRGGVEAQGYANTNASFFLTTSVLIPFAKDYTYVSCNPYTPDCYDRNSWGSCDYYPEVTSFPSFLDCSSTRHANGCSRNPSPPCAQQCGGGVDFRGITASLALT